MWRAMVVSGIILMAALPNRTMAGQTGNAYLHYVSETQRIFFIVGFVDGLRLAVNLQLTASSAAVDIPVSRLWDQCIESREYGQIRTIVENWLRNHPEQWHRPMDELVFQALVESCPLYFLTAPAPAPAPAVSPPLDSGLK
jgi:hypothetical protein